MFSLYSLFVNFAFFLTPLNNEFYMSLYVFSIRAWHYHFANKTHNSAESAYHGGFGYGGPGMCAQQSKHQLSAALSN